MTFPDKIRVNGVPFKVRKNGGIVILTESRRNYILMNLKDNQQLEDEREDYSRDRSVPIRCIFRNDNPNYALCLYGISYHKSITGFLTSGFNLKVAEGETKELVYDADDLENPLKLV